jgi:methyl-accepting chemotaxis protein
MWDRLSIRFKIPAAILGFALAVGAGIGLSSYFSASSEIQKLTKRSVGSDCNQPGQRADRLFAHHRSRSEARQHASRSRTMPLAAFDGAWQEIDGDHTEILKAAYMRDNPHPLGEKHLLDTGWRRYRL